jgi:multiple sugar transport system ATP-binding protein
MNLLNGAVAQQFGAGTIGIRPEHIAASRDRGDWQGVVRVAEHLGSDTFLHIDAETVGRITARAPGELALAAGDKVALTPRPDRIHRFDSDGRAMRA